MSAGFGTDETGSGLTEPRDLTATAMTGADGSPAVVGPAAAPFSIQVPAGALSLQGDLALPGAPLGVVLFAHGSGSGRLSPRNRYVAERLNRAGLATLLLDLLTPAEESDRANVFDVPLLANRLAYATRWIRGRPETASLALGTFGASTGAAAALWAAAEPGATVAAVVSRGGRPDLAAGRLRAVSAPTLLIVGGDDRVVLRLNEEALELLPGERRLTVVPGATHLFEEPGALERVAELAAGWFVTHLDVRAD